VRGRRLLAMSRLESLHERLSPVWDALGRLDELRGRVEVAGFLLITALGIAVVVAGLVVGALGSAGAILVAVGVALLVVALGLLHWWTRAARRDRALVKHVGGPDKPIGVAAAVPSGHGLLGVGRDWIRCRCGWTGSSPNFDRHVAGDPVASTNKPLDPPPVPDRAVLADLATAAWQELMENRDLSPSVINADARSKAVRRWSHTWEVDVERALASDAAKLADFRHPVDTSQMHYVDSPGFVLWTKLRLLDVYLPASIRAEMDLQERWDTAGVQPPTKVISSTDPEAGASPTADRGLVHSEILAGHGVHELSEHLVTRPVAPVVSESAVDLRPEDGIGLAERDSPAASGLDQPPPDWTASDWHGNQVLRCQWDAYRTIDPAKFEAHLETHTDPPTDQLAHEQYDEPRPWATIPFHYVGDGSAYVNGVPANPAQTLYGSRTRVEELLAYGLFAEGPVDSDSASWEISP
jgi:hypothetical protein